jgi:anti-sigma B factor antagonist
MLAREVAMELALSSRHVEGFEIIEVGGEIDVYTAPKLREAIVTAVEAGANHLIIDVEKVDFLDSTGLGVLVGALKRIRADGGSLDIVCTHERILKIFAITGLDKVFGLHASVEEARAAAHS